MLDLDGTIHSRDLANADFVQYHPQYPLLLPLAEQHIYALLGEVNDRWSKVLFPLLYLGLVLTFAGVLQRHTLCARAWLFALVTGDGAGADALGVRCFSARRLTPRWPAFTACRSSICGTH